MSHSITVAGQDARQDFRDQVEQTVQQALKQASEQMAKANKELQAAGQPAIAGPPIDQARIDILQAQIAGERQTIDKLTGQLVPGLSSAREEAINQQIEDARDHLQTLQGQLSRALGVPEEVEQIHVPPPEFDFGGEQVPPEVVPIVGIVFGTLMITILGYPLIRFWTRRAERKFQAPPAAPDQSPRLDRIEQAIEAVAIEVERVSEGQRFTTKLLSDMRSLPAPNPMNDWKGGAARQPEAVERHAEGKTSG
jgi:hypothetical protein